MTTAKCTINTWRAAGFVLQELMKRVVVSRCGVEVLEILLLQPSRPGYKRYFIPPHIHTFVLLAQDLTKDNNLLHTFWGIQASLLQ
jgi:hypothetical protein